MTIILKTRLQNRARLFIIFYWLIIVVNNIFFNKRILTIIILKIFGFTILLLNKILSQIIFHHIPDINMHIIWESQFYSFFKRLLTEILRGDSYRMYSINQRTDSNTNMLFILNLILLEPKDMKSMSDWENYICSGRFSRIYNINNNLWREFQVWILLVDIFSKLNLNSQIKIQLFMSFCVLHFIPFFYKLLFDSLFVSKKF
jgi:hypothetical protein